MTSSLPSSAAGPPPLTGASITETPDCSGGLGEFPAGVGVDGAVDGHHPAGRQPSQHAGVAVQDLPDVVVADDAYADQIAGSG